MENKKKWENAYFLLTNIHLGVLLLLALRQRPVAQLMCGHILGFRVVVVGVVEGVVVVVVKGVWTTVVVVVTVIVVDFVVVVGWVEFEELVG